MRKICVVITARASFGRVKTVLLAIKNRQDCDLQLIICGSALFDKFGSPVNWIEDDGFEITAKVNTLLEPGQVTAAAKTTGLGIIELSTIFENLRPDIVVTIADRYETMATAIAASYMNIPLAHIQGGEVTGNIDEKVRHAVTKLADLHFVATTAARQRVLKLGESPDKIHLTGCPSIDIAMGISKRNSLTFEPYKLYGGVGEEPDLAQRYLVVLQHPVTTELGNAQSDITCTLEAIKTVNLPTLWFWPNADPGTCGISKGIRTFREANDGLPIHFFRSMRTEHFLELIKNSACLIGNSSTGIREAAYLGVPVVNIGNRQNGRERGQNVVDVTPNTDLIEQAIRHQLNHGPYPPDFLYGKGDAGRQIAQILAEATLTFDKQITF
ncbi:UDP-N-acetylglucosamine 2-epimerase [Dyadobacter luticola]|uniref:UDP-N-acetylglucosamine 2-epimerase (Hydrolyzing) n=1 Tax=Dyadobacter luticola TaxID=1979387 RepID=A0A5R9KPW6_9BACT|nr:UDP-N-acetylglucosamine 2-epimerase [Dyadobacter luticola]TLU98199.1 UDP-N-acetylglucosamine 2-epimerase (hydrolyzing) [Dyadobacter luticola]